MSTPIKREDIRKGDRIRRSVVSEYTATRDGTPLDRGQPYEYDLLDRPEGEPAQ